MVYMSHFSADECLDWVDELEKAVSEAPMGPWTAIQHGAGFDVVAGATEVVAVNLDRATAKLLVLLRNDVKFAKIRKALEDLEDTSDEMNRLEEDVCDAERERDDAEDEAAILKDKLDAAEEALQTAQTELEEAESCISELEGKLAEATIDD